MDQFGGGSWNMIPTMVTHSNPTTPSNQEYLYLQQQQQFQQQQQQQFQQQQKQQFQLQPQQQHQQRYQISQQQQQHQQQQQQQQQPSQSLASHFHLLNLMDNLSNVIENGTQDQHFDTLTVEGQKHKVDECEQMLSQRRDLIAKYRNSVAELTKLSCE